MAEVLTVSGGLPAWADPSVSGSIDQLSDVDITTTPPVEGDALVAEQYESGVRTGNCYLCGLRKSWRPG